jgi:hypothetical protein
MTALAGETITTERPTQVVCSIKDVYKKNNWFILLFSLSVYINNVLGKMMGKVRDRLR